MKALGRLSPLLAIPLLAALLALGVACQAGGLLTARQPAEDWVRADRATFDVVAPRLRAYVSADVTLQPSEQSALLGLLDDWKLRLEQGERIYPPEPDAGAEGGGH